MALAVGAMGAGGAAVVLQGMDDGNLGESPPAAIAGASEMVYEVAPFEEISTTGPQNVVVAYGETFSVRAEGSPQALSLLEATVDDGRLSIGPETGFNWGGSRRLEDATFFVTMPRLDAVAVAGSGDVQIDQVRGERFSGTIVGSGELSVARIEAEEADLTVNGSGDISAAGEVQDARIQIGGSGEIGAVALRSQIASISIAGSGDVELSVEEDARISIMGSGDVEISGPARCAVTRMGGGEVRCGGREIDPS